MSYENNQPGWLIRIAIAWGILVSLIGPMRVAIVREAAPSWVGLVPAVILVLVLILFHCLKVQVNADRVMVGFGIGLIRYHFSLLDIESCSAVKTQWHNGWGIRKIQHGWLLNVSGMDAVEIKLSNGRVYRIGTNDPKGLLTAIESAIAK